jgi:hypothetical protein
MRIEMFDGEEQVRVFGATVVRSNGADVLIELGPSDGPPHVRLRLSRDEATKIGVTLSDFLTSGDGEVVIVND